MIDPAADTPPQIQGVRCAGCLSCGARAAADLKPQDLLTILFTSGTTGPSKGVCCPHAQYFWWGYTVARQLDLREGDVLHTTLPLFHVNALCTFFQALLTGWTQVVEKRMSVSNFWPALVASGATVTYVLGAMVPMLMSRPPGEDERRHKVRCALAPGVPLQMQSRSPNAPALYCSTAMARPKATR